MAPKIKRVKFIDDEAVVDDEAVERNSSDEEEEGDDPIDGFLYDYPGEPVLDDCPRPSFSATDSGGTDLEAIEKYVKSVKRRDQESNRVGGSSSTDESVIPHRPQLWMLPVPAGMEIILAESLLELSQKKHKDWGIYHVPYLPRRIYIEAPGIVEIQELMKLSAYSHLASRATRILDDVNRDFLHRTSIPDVPCPGSWVRITQAGLYKGDLALVNLKPSEGDVISIAVVPRSNISQNKKRKSSRATPALLDPIFFLKSPTNEDNMLIIGSRMFHSSGLEFLLAPSAHSLKIELHPSEAELALFQSCFERDIFHDAEDKTYSLIQHAINKAFSKESKKLWQTGDRVRILEGAFKGTSSSIHEIDEDNQIAIVGFGSPTPTLVEVRIEDLERHFIVGDQVRVALGKNKGKNGSIIVITDDIGTIVEGTANQLTEFQVFLSYLETHTLNPSFSTTPHPAASTISKPKPHGFEGPIYHTMLGGRDPRIGRDAAIYLGHLKGYQGRLIEINQHFGTGAIETPGRNVPICKVSLSHLVLIDTPTHNLAGAELDKPYVGRDLMRPEPSLPRTSTPPPLADELPELTLEERAIELGSGAFLRDPKTCANLEGFHVWLGFQVTYENGSFAMRHAHTPLPDKFIDANGLCSHHEVCMILTDHRTAIPFPRRVELRHLKPVPPKKKGDWIVVISGDHRGIVAEVIACRTKASKAEVFLNGSKIVFNFLDICRLTKPE